MRGHLDHVDRPARPVGRGEGRRSGVVHPATITAGVLTNDVDIWNVLASLATVGALVAALWQLRRGVQDGRSRDEARRVERALEMYQSVIAEGATHDAFHRLSVLLRRIGTMETGCTTWHVLRDEDLTTGGILDPQDVSKEQAFADLYAVIWFFERCELTLRRGLVSEDVLFETLGFHFWWWGQVLLELKGPKASQSVHRLAVRSTEWARQAEVLSDWVSRCTTDFNGGPGQSPGPSVPLRSTG